MLKVDMTIVQQRVERMLINMDELFSKRDHLRIFGVPRGGIPVAHMVAELDWSTEFPPTR